MVPVVRARRGICKLCLLYLSVKVLGVPGAERWVGASYLSALRELPGVRLGGSVGCVCGKPPGLGFVNCVCCICR